MMLDMSYVMTGSVVIQHLAIFIRPNPGESDLGILKYSVAGMDLAPANGASASWSACGPPPLCVSWSAGEKRWRATAIQNLAAFSTPLSKLVGFACAALPSSPSFRLRPATTRQADATSRRGKWVKITE